MAGLRYEDLLQRWHFYRPFLLLCAPVVAVALWALTLRSKTYRSSSALLADEKPKLLSRPTSAFERNLTREGFIQEKSAVTTVVQPKNAPKRIAGSRKSPNGKHSHGERIIQPLVFFFSLGGSTEGHAKTLVENLEHWQADKTLSNILSPKLLDLSYIELDDYFITLPRQSAQLSYVYLILTPSYDIDSQMTNFLEHLQETHNDFRIDTSPLSEILGYSVFGFGDKEGWPTEEEGFCVQARQVDKWMAKLTGRKRAFPLGVGDVKSDALERLEEWRAGMQEIMFDLAAGKGLGEGVPGSGDPVESDEEDEDVEYEVDQSTTKKRRPGTGLGDLEDLGGIAKKEKQSNAASLATDFTTSRSASTAKEMVPTKSPTYSSLTKQGYTIVGSHSGVKICRWTKSALRGRGSCYKYSFYGIQSHLCMETTPSLSCSNKCVFCWRHGTNPVGTTWRWKVDPPELIFNGVKEGHYKKIKSLRGVPGVRAERFQEAMRIRHCALSLVGEPIFYPHINTFLALLHTERISSFLVCNAQHPRELAALKQVTQLYVSIDASNRDSLRAIDRPLHRDFWERFTSCMDILRAARFRQRTVFRLTLVKGFNIDNEVQGYADLVERALPCFVEVKGVTYCGTSTSKGAGLTMQNVPYYHEIQTFVTALTDELQRRGLGYGMAAEHAHSCCCLIASERFNIGGKWHTKIDYERFFELLETREDGGFTPEEYCAETPEWALWGNGGFDPRDVRVDRKGRPKDIAGTEEKDEAAAKDIEI